MRDRRPVDDLSIEELERILAIRKREQRMQRLERMRQSGRVMDAPQVPASDSTPARPTVAEKVQPAASKPRPTEPELETSPRFEEDVFAEPRYDDPEAAAMRRSIFNRVLLGVEVAAVFGLLFIGVNMVISINALQRETQQAQELVNLTRLQGMPTPAPTSILSVRVEDYVLPGGHVVDANDPSRVRINLDEIIEAVPAHLQVAVQQQALAVDIVRPPQTPETALYISIERLNIEQSIVQGADWEALKSGIGQVQNGAYPGGETGNVVLAAHNDIYSELFRYLDTMEVGDLFYIHTASKIYTYRVTGSDIVAPTDIYVMQDQGRPTVTLISCYPYRVNNKRYVVFAERVDFPGA